MLAHIYMLSGGKRIKEILEKGKRTQSDSFGVFHLDRGNDNYSKFAFVISTKISKLAVHRNRVRRAMSESIRRNVARIPAGIDFVFLAKKEVVKKTTDEIMREVEDFITKFKK